MLRISSQSLLRSVSHRATTPRVPNSFRRYLSSASTTYGPRSWKSSIARWVIAGGLVYYYNTSNVFAEEPFIENENVQSLSHNVENMPKLDQAVEERRKRVEAAAQKSLPMKTQENDTSNKPAEGETARQAESPEELEREAEGEGAFNPETGEINWDCPCLGGMAHGPCGEEFKAAFSCFVYSEQEPKGMDCIEKFKGMQDCFRQHPDVYGEELDGEDAEVEEPENTNAAANNSRNEIPENTPITSTTEKPYNKPKEDQEQLSNNLKANVAVSKDQDD